MSAVPMPDQLREALMTKPIRFLAAAALGVAVLLTACSGDSAGPTTSARVTFHVSSTPGAGASGLTAVSDTLVGSGPDTLVLDSVQLVLRDIRFKRVEDSACDDVDDDLNDDHVAAFHDDSVDDGDDACESYNAGPFLLDVPLDSGLAKAFSVAVDTGTYDELRIKIHKPEDDGDPLDAQFLIQHPEFADVSIRAVGTWNGTPFAFTTDLSAEQRMNLVPPLVVAQAMSQVDVTIQVDVTAWFADGLGGYVDPATANEGGVNEQLVEDNIKDSFRAFRAEDHDGHDDDGDDDNGDDDDD
jgi:hypothetical protein